MVSLHLGKEIHIHAPAYKQDELEQVLKLCDHIVFNSLSQWKRYQNILASNTLKTSIALRINPEYSEIDTGNIIHVCPILVLELQKRN